MTNDTRPPVAPVEGHYAMLRNGDIVGPFSFGTQEYSAWDADGSYVDTDFPELDIVSLISPADMQALASGELERLRAALKEIVAADDNYKAASNFMKDSFSDGYSDGLHDAAYVARAALAKMEESKSCKS